MIKAVAASKVISVAMVTIRYNGYLSNECSIGVAGPV
jgi:hypothetical protein